MAVTPEATYSWRGKSEQSAEARRVCMRSVPLFPLRRDVRRRTQSTGGVASTITKPKINSRNANYKSGRSNFKIPVYKTVDYKHTARPKIDSTSAVHVAPKTPTARVKMVSNDIKHFKNVPAKVDTSDPVPWAHSQTRRLEELVDRDGLRVNARIVGMIKSRSLGSQREIEEAVESETERLFQRIVGGNKAEEEASDVVVARNVDVQQKPGFGATPLKVEDVEQEMQALQISYDHSRDEDNHQSHDDEDNRHSHDDEDNRHSHDNNHDIDHQHDDDHHRPHDNRDDDHAQDDDNDHNDEDSSGTNE